MRKLMMLGSLLGLLIACEPSDRPAMSTSSMTKLPSTTPKIKRDLNDIKEDGVLKTLMVYSGTSYFLYRGQAMGFEYELLQRLADHLDLKLEIIIAKDLDDLITMLNEGQADLIAHGMTITKDRKKQVAFSKDLYFTNQVLIQRKPTNWRSMKLHEIDKTLVSDPIELIGDTVAVRKNSSYYKRIKNLESELGDEIFIDTVDGSMPTDKIIEMVVDKEIKYTVADKNIASINASYYPILDINTAMSSTQRVGWAVRKNSKKLRKAIDKWLKSFKKTVDFPVIYNKYFKNKRSFKERARSEFYSQNSDRLSPYDEIVQEYAPIVSWDWRFISAVIYQESQFNPNSKSWVSASGLMQLMPATAKELNVTDITDPEQNIRGGVTYLNQLWEQWETVPDSIQRVKFTLASYNCGLGHVQDAQRLTEAEQGDPLVWDNMVENSLLDLTYPKNFNKPIIKYGYVRGMEPVEYVRQIFDHYSHYEELVPM
ncbi:MAG: transporter substrate-binding domain-containing protein [Saprospiraceae bacterium]|nr:transporter substrate-binding domain-containing protein [Saprospiraceae bacterium]